MINVPLVGLGVDDSSVVGELTVEDSQSMVVDVMADASPVVDNAFPLFVPSIGAIEDSQAMVVAVIEDASTVVDNALPLLVPSIGACSCENENCL